MDVTLQLLIGAVVGYVFGMLPTGMIVGRALGVDLTQTGSGRTGATNVLRTLGVKWAVVVAFGDILKGAVPVLIVGWLTQGAPWWGAPTWGQVAAAGSPSRRCLSQSRNTTWREPATGIAARAPRTPAS